MAINQVFQKFPTDVRYPYFDFSLFPEVATNGETLQSATVSIVTGDGSLTATFQAISMTEPWVYFELASGTAGAIYNVECAATTNTSASVLTIAGQVSVIDPTSL